MFTRTLRMAFWVIYDHLGKLLALNLAVLPLSVLPGMIAAVLLENSLFPANIYWAVLMGAAVFWGGLIGFALLTASVSLLIDRAEAPWGEWTVTLGRVFRRSLLLGVPLYGIAAVLLGSAYIYLVRWSTHLPWLGYPGGAVALWLFLLGAASMHLLVPALAYPHPSWWQPLRIALMLTLDNPGYVLLMSLFTVSTLMVAFFVPVLLLGYPLLWAALAGSGYELLARKYAITAGSEAVRDENDNYLNRGFQDFFFPWKG